MSQYYQSGDGGAPGVPGIESVTGNSGGAVFGAGSPVNLDLLGDTAQGVTVTGTPASSLQTVSVQDATAAATSGAALKGVSSYDSDDFTVTSGFVELTSSLTGSAVTVGATTETILTIPLLMGQVVTVQCVLAAFEGTTPVAIGGQLVLTAFWSGVGDVTIVEVPDKIVNASIALTTADFDASGSSNNLLIEVTGEAALTINWSAKAQVVFSA